MSKPRKLSLGAIALNAMEQAQVPQEASAPEDTTPAPVVHHITPVPAAAETAPVQSAPVAAPVRQVRRLPVRQKAPPAPVAGKGTVRDRARQMSLYLEDPVYEQVREIAHIERVKMHQLILEGVDLMLKRRGYASIKELIAKAEREQTAE